MSALIRNFYRLSFVLCAVALTGCTAVERLAIPSSELENQAYLQIGIQSQVNHQVLDDFLARYLTNDENGVARVNYGGVTVQDQQALDGYIDYLSSVDSVSLTRDAQLAYWANLYNSKTISVLLEHYPVDSIRGITDGFLDVGPWEEKRLVVDGRELSLHDIEHKIIRPIWPDPRIHYILNCAAVGCPNLAARAYRSETIEQAMELAAANYVNNPRGVSINEHDSLTLSKIYSWYVGDFGGSEEAVIEHIRRYAEPELRAKLAGRTSVDSYRYDWSLNDSTLQ